MSVGNSHFYLLHRMHNLEVSHFQSHCYVFFFLLMDGACLFCKLLEKIFLFCYQKVLSKLSSFVLVSNNNFLLLSFKRKFSKYASFFPFSIHLICLNFEKKKHLFLAIFQQNIFINIFFCR